MIGADDVDTLVFDVLGTVVDEAGSMRAELAAALDRAGAGGQAAELAAAWADPFAGLVSAIRAGAVAICRRPQRRGARRHNGRRAAAASGHGPASGPGRAPAQGMA